MSTFGDREDARAARIPHGEELCRFLGRDWEPVGDGTYRYVGPRLRTRAQLRSVGNPESDESVDPAPLRTAPPLGETTRAPQMLSGASPPQETGKSARAAARW